MTGRDGIRSLVFSWDWVLALSLALSTGLFLPSGLTFSLAKEVYGISISVLSIVFSVFFASLAILITAGDNEFVGFLEQDGAYSRVVWTFKVTLLLLATALVFSILLYVTALPACEQSVPTTYPRMVFMVFCAGGLYALLATVHSAFDIIRYAELRAKYITIVHKGDTKNETGS